LGFLFFVFVSLFFLFIGFFFLIFVALCFLFCDLDFFFFFVIFFLLLYRVCRIFILARFCFVSCIVTQTVYCCGRDNFDLVRDCCRSGIFRRCDNCLCFVFAFAFFLCAILLCWLACCAVRLVAVLVTVRNGVRLARGVSFFFFCWNLTSFRPDCAALFHILRK